MAQGSECLEPRRLHTQEREGKCGACAHSQIGDHLCQLRSNLGAKIEWVFGDFIVQLYRDYKGIELLLYIQC